ncbi:MAG: DUF2318 domain-containing protein [Chloroflexota bacterium]
MSGREVRGRGGRRDTGRDTDGRRAQFLEVDERPRRGWGIVPLLALALGVGLVLMGAAMLLGVGRSPQSASPAVASSGAAGGGATARRSVGQFTEVTATNGAVMLSAANFQDGKAKYFTYKAGNKDIDFFVVKSSDGVVRAAIDSCDVCYQARKGYRQEGDEMVCNNCGQRFASNKINEVKGGCNPVPLDRSLEGEQLKIEQQDILEGGRYF